MAYRFLFLCACAQPTLVGPTSLVRVDQEAPGEHCPAGGAAIVSGVDSNGDGVLGDDEVGSQPQYICQNDITQTTAGVQGAGPPGATGSAGANGADGVTGAQGADGAMGATGATGPPGVAPAVVPAGVTTAKANYVYFSRSTGGLLIHSPDTTGLVVPTGAFNGGGTGNKGFVGFDAYAGRAFKTLKSIDVHLVQTLGPASNVYFNFLVDTDGDGVWSAGTDCIVVQHALSITNGVSTDYFVDMAATAFHAVGPNPINCGLQSNSSPTASPLSDLTGYTSGNAKLIDAQTGDGGMPAGVIMPAVLLVINDSATRSQRLIELKDATIVWDGAGGPDIIDTFAF